MRQFTAGGHVLGFQPDGVYVVGGDHALKVEFAGARAVAPTVNGDWQPETRNPGPATPLGKVTYADLWDGVTLVYERSADAVVKSTYYVAPHSHPVERIRLRYNAPVQVDAGGGLIFGFATGQLRESAPVAWQEIAGQRVAVAVSFRLLAEREVGFALGEYDPGYPLVIDPFLSWHTFMGSSSWDYGIGIAVDGSGNVYVAGYSYATWGSPLNAHAGGNDAFAAKLDSSGVRRRHAFMGSSGDDTGIGIAVDGSGNVYVTGRSPATWRSPVTPHAGDQDAFVAKLDEGRRVFLPLVVKNFTP